MRNLSKQINCNGTSLVQSHYDVHIPYHSQSTFVLWKALLEGKICRDKLVSSPSAPGILQTPVTAVTNLWVPHVSALVGERHCLSSKHPVWKEKVLACSFFWWRFGWFKLQTFEENKNVWMPSEWVTTQFWIRLLAWQSIHCRERISWSWKRYWTIGL